MSSIPSPGAPRHYLPFVAPGPISGCSRVRKPRRWRRAAVLALGLLACGGARAATALETGPSGLPLPRFVSLKSDKVYVRGGPGTDHRVKWVFTKTGLPVEIVQEFENWRRIRDSEGAEGWVWHSLLSSRRTALVSPWGSKDPIALRSDEAKDARIVAYLEPHVLAVVRRCDGHWCEVSGNGWDGYVQQVELWGVYPNEVVK